MRAVSAGLAGLSSSSMVATRSVVWPTSSAQFVAAGLACSSSMKALNEGKRNQPPSLSRRSSGGITGLGMPRGAGASDTPQFPATTVVTPWLTLGAISGAESIRRSSWVCASMKPGATIRPEASSSVPARALSSLPIAAMRSPRTAMSAV